MANSKSNSSTLKKSSEAARLSRDRIKLERQIKKKEKKLAAAKEDQRLTNEYYSTSSTTKKKTK